MIRRGGLGKGITHAQSSITHTSDSFGIEHLSEAASGETTTAKLQYSSGDNGNLFPVLVCMCECVSDVCTLFIRLSEYEINMCLCMNIYNHIHQKVPISSSDVFVFAGHTHDVLPIPSTFSGLYFFKFRCNSGSNDGRLVKHVCINVKHAFVLVAQHRPIGGQQCACGAHWGGASQR